MIEEESKQLRQVLGFDVAFESMKITAEFESVKLAIEEGIDYKELTLTADEAWLWLCNTHFKTKRERDIIIKYVESVNKAHSDLYGYMVEKMCEEEKRPKLEVVK